MGRYGWTVNDNQWRHVGRFLSVGMLGTLLDVGLFSVMRLGLHWPVLMANTLAYSAGIVNNYLLHRNWCGDLRRTYDEAGPGERARVRRARRQDDRRWHRRSARRAPHARGRAPARGVAPEKPDDAADVKPRPGATQDRSLILPRTGMEPIKPFVYG